MIGNDIIDIEITRAESNWRRDKFLSKIFSASEQLLIMAAKCPEMMVWSLWSRKEAAYKIYNRKTKLRVYNPLQFECSNMYCFEGNYYGDVVMNNSIYFTQTQINSEYIHSVAVTNKDDLKNVFVIKDATAIEKKDGIPYIFDNNILKPVSISHHGKYTRIVSINLSPALT